jgi:hypothetical protein
MGVYYGYIFAAVFMNTKNNRQRYVTDFTSLRVYNIVNIC